ncbi:MAG: hypothetical protein GXO20_08280 [Thermodesulfobacteria bacterium]|nr:hypothetical protein [Thermodesulfobacteriota bacterium]
MKISGPNFKNLEALKKLSQKDREAALKKACQEFEALFLYQILKGLRKTVPEGGFWPKSFQRELYEDFFYQEVSREVAARGTGLGKLLYRELAKKYGGVK